MKKQYILIIILFIALGLIIGVLIGRNVMKTDHREQILWESIPSDKAETADQAPAGEPKTSALVLDTRAAGQPAKEASLAEILADRQVYFTGIDDVTINRSTVIYLENMPENDDILMQYVIVDKESGDTLETTGLIPSGESIAWVPGEKLADGSYTLIFMEKPFYEYQGEYIALTQGNNEVNITIQS